MVQHETGIITVKHNPPCVTECDLISQAFALHIRVLQAIKYWRWEQPGNEAMLEVV